MRIVKVTGKVESDNFIKEAIQDYEDIVTKLIKDIESKCQNKPNSTYKKLEMLYQYFINLNIKYATWTLVDGGLGAAGPIGRYKTKHSGFEGEFEIGFGEKLAPILIQKGVCASYSSTFCDIARRLGIDCAVVYNSYHAWNSILIDDEIWYLDLTPIIKEGKKNIPLNSALKNSYNTFNLIEITTDKYDNRYNSQSICFDKDGQILSKKELINFLKKNKVNKSIIKNVRITSLDSTPTDTTQKKDNSSKTNMTIRKVTKPNGEVINYQNTNNQAVKNVGDLVKKIIAETNQKVDKMKINNPKTQELCRLRYALKYLKEERERLDEVTYNIAFEDVLRGLGFDETVITSLKSNKNIMQNLSRG